MVPFRVALLATTNISGGGKRELNLQFVRIIILEQVGIN
jgi:hypothetical protein